MVRLRFVVPVFAVALLSSGFLMGEDKKTDKEPIFIRGQLPRYYKQLGLSDNQKKRIYKIHYDYTVKIDDLQKQIAALKKKEKSDMENVLTEGQKTRLRELQSSGSSKNKEIKESPAEVKRK